MSAKRRNQEPASPGSGLFSSLPGSAPESPEAAAAAAAGYALSIKQPWAALLLHGLKTIEIRRWATARRGRVLIHAARVPDPQPIGWSHVTDEIRPTTQLLGGIIGVGEITDCLVYRTPEAFTADRARHLNDPSWFHEPALFGFVFVQLRRLPFQKVSGNVRFFRVGPG